MRGGLSVLAVAALSYCAPFLLLMLWAAILKAPLAFALLGVFGVFAVIISARDANRSAAKPIERPRENRFPMEDTRPPAEGARPQPFRPVRMRHWHEAVGPQVRRPLWTVPKRRE
jgi:hypothetical protein